MELFIIIAVIVGLALLVSHGEKEKRIRIHGYDWKKPDSQRTQSERDFINKTGQDEEIMKQFNYIQMGLKSRERQLRVYVAEHGMDDYALKEMDTCLMSLDAFQEYANKLPANLGSELMNVAKGETYARARREASKTSFYGLDEVTEIHKHKDALVKLFVVMNKCKEHNNINKKDSVKQTNNAKAEYNQFNDDLFS